MDSVARDAVVGCWVDTAGISGVAVGLGVVKKLLSVAVAGGGSGARLFWQLPKQLHEVHRLLATLQGQATERAVGLDKAQVEDLEQSQQR